MRLPVFLSFFLLFPSLAFAAAEAPASRFALMPFVSTLGVGLDVEYRLSSLAALRLSGAVHTLPDRITQSRVVYHADGANRSVGALLDVFPWRNGFRLSIGVYYIRLKANITSSLSFKNPVYSRLADETKGTATWERAAPYLGLGWAGGKNKRGLTWHCSAGALYMGKASVHLQRPAIVVPSRLLPRLANAQADMTRNAHRYRWYPVVSLGFAYRF